MPETVRKLLRAVLIVVFCVSGGLLLWHTLDYRRGAADYAAAAALVLPDPKQKLQQIETQQAAEPTPNPDEPAPEWHDPYAEFFANMDLSALQAKNPDVFGWITLPGTSISYPLVQGTDNSYYLSHTATGASSAVGAIFLDCRNSGDLSDFNTILYGHRMRDGSMFAGLKYYTDQSYADAHRDVYVTTASGVTVYRIFAAYIGSSTGSSYTLSFADTAARQTYLDTICAQSAITGDTPTTAAQILTLSTCTGGSHANRLLVHAYA